MRWCGSEVSAHLWWDGRWSQASWKPVSHSARDTKHRSGHKRASPSTRRKAGAADSRRLSCDPCVHAAARMHSHTHAHTKITNALNFFFQKLQRKISQEMSHTIPVSCPKNWKFIFRGVGVGGAAYRAEQGPVQRHEPPSLLRSLSTFWPFIHLCTFVV